MKIFVRLPQNIDIPTAFYDTNILAMGYKWNKNENYSIKTINRILYRIPRTNKFVANGFFVFRCLRLVTA